MLSLEETLEKYNLTKEKFQAADISWEELTEIYKDYSAKQEQYEKILMDFKKDFLLETKGKGIHSFTARTKDPEHLIVKIIRKKIENYGKYKDLTKDNYEKFVTDLMGIRCLILFKTDWLKVHEFLCYHFENNPEKYIRDYQKDYNIHNISHNMAEAPEVNIRYGDDRSIYEGILRPDKILTDKIYRSVHYVLRYQGHYVEVQVRTLFEEGWSEIEHSIVYPYYVRDTILSEYSALLNRMAGIADEMGTYFVRVGRMRKTVSEEEQKEKVSRKQVPATVPEPNNMYQIEKKSASKKPSECLKDIILE